MEHLIPPCTPVEEASLRSAFLAAGLETALENDLPLSSDLIIKVGRAVREGPCKAMRQRMHELFFRINAAVENDKKYFTPKRYYLCGDYCGTAVVSYEHTTLTCFVERGDAMPSWPSLYKSFKKIIDTNAACQQLGVVCQVHDDHLTIHTDDVGLKIGFADCSFGAGPKLAETATKLYASLLTSDRSERTALSHALGEVYARFINIIPENWKSFVRFCKLWALRNFTGLRMELVESIAVKVLVNEDPKLSNEALDFNALFFEFLSAMASDVDRREAESVSLPPTAFTGPRVRALNAKFEAYGPQPEVGGADHEAIKKRFCGNDCVTSIVDPSENLAAGMGRRQWAVLRLAAEEPLLKHDEEGEISLRMLFEMTADGPVPVFPGRRMATRVLRNTMVLLMFALLMSLIAVQCVAMTLCHGDGSLDIQKVYTLEMTMVESVGRAEAWGVQNGLSPLLDSTAYAILADRYEYICLLLSQEEALADLWHLIPGAARVEFVKNGEFLMDSFTQLKTLCLQAWVAHRLFHANLKEKVAGVTKALVK